MRTLWVCNVAGGPLEYTATRPGKTTVGLEEAHRDLRIAPAEFDEVAAELGRTLDFFKVPKREKDEVLGAFAAHKNEVTRRVRRPGALNLEVLDCCGSRYNPARIAHIFDPRPAEIAQRTHGVARACRRAESRLGRKDSLYKRGSVVRITRERGCSRHRSGRRGSSTRKW